MPRSTHTQPPAMTRFRVHWSRIFAAFAVGMALGFMICWALVIATT